MKHNEFMRLEEKCPKCQSELMLQKTSWSDMSGGLHYVFCESANVKGTAQMTMKLHLQTSISNSHERKKMTAKSQRRSSPTFVTTF